MIIGRSIDLPDRRELIHWLMEVSGQDGSRMSGRPIEVTAVRADQLQPLPLEPEMDFIYGECRRKDYDAGYLPQPWTNPDLAAIVATVLAGSETHFGPAPADLIEPIPHERLTACIQASVPYLLEDLDDDFNVLLTLTRMWFTVETGDIVTKDVAADWALDRLPQDLRPALVRVRDPYLGRATEDTSGSDPRPIAQFLSEVVLGRRDSTRTGNQYPATARATAPPP